MLKCANLLYLFDFDGTIAGSNQWHGVIQNAIDCFRTGPHLVPNRYDIRWGILSGRPRIDRWFIQMFCMLNGLVPQQIFLSPTLLYKYKNDEENYADKENTIKSILDGKTDVSFTPVKIERIAYIDNDYKCLKYLNGHVDNYRYVAMSVPDFCKERVLLTTL